MGVDWLLRWPTNGNSLFGHNLQIVVRRVAAVLLMSLMAFSLVWRRKKAAYGAAFRAEWVVHIEMAIGAWPMTDVTCRELRSSLIRMKTVRQATPYKTGPSRADENSGMVDLWGAENTGGPKRPPVPPILDNLDECCLLLTGRALA
jgi:hypothetical protein